jgi:hypothetical protein
MLKGGGATLACQGGAACVQACSGDWRGSMTQRTTSIASQGQDGSRWELMIVCQCILAKV